MSTPDRETVITRDEQRHREEVRQIGWSQCSYKTGVDVVIAMPFFGSVDGFAPVLCKVQDQTHLVSTFAKDAVKQRIAMALDFTRNLTDEQLLHELPLQPEDLKR